MDCPLCALETSEHNGIWKIYGQRLSAKDVYRILQKSHPDLETTEDQINEHFRTHPFEQSTPDGRVHRSQALQEALTTFPKYLYFLFRALYRAKAMSERQIYAALYLDRAADSPELHRQMAEELHRLVARNYLYKVHTSQFTGVAFEDPGPIYYIGRQAIPLVEKLEGIPPGELPSGNYMTNFQNIQPYHLEKDIRLVDVIVAMRQKLYQREFQYAGKELQVHLAIEHWFCPAQLLTELDMGGDNQITFTPEALLGMRAETRDGALSALLPMWLEYDRGTEDIADVLDSINCYGHYYNSSYYKQKFPRLAESGSPGPLIVLCETPYRRDELSAALAAVLPQKLVPIYLADRTSFCNDPYAEALLTSPQQSDKNYNLLERLLYHNQELITHRTLIGTDHLDDPSVSQLLSAQSDEPTAVAPVQTSVAPNFDSWGN